MYFFRFHEVCPTLLWILDSRVALLMLLKMSRNSPITLARSVSLMLECLTRWILFAKYFTTKIQV